MARALLAAAVLPFVLVGRAQGGQIEAVEHVSAEQPDGFSALARGAASGVIKPTRSGKGTQFSGSVQDSPTIQPARTLTDSQSGATWTITLDRDDFSSEEEEPSDAVSFPPITLIEALEFAYQRNPQLQAAREVSRATNEGVAQARSAYLPRVDLIGAYSSQVVEQDEFGLNEPTLDVREGLNPNSVGIEASQELFTGLRRRGQGQAATAQSRAAAARLAETEQRIFFSVVSAYADLHRDLEIVRVRRQNLDVLRQERHAAQQRFKAGAVTLTDVAQAEARLSSGEAGLAAAEADVERSRATLTALLDTTVGEVAAPVLDLRAPAILPDALEQAMRLNPALVAARHNEDSAKAQVRIERAGLLPPVSAIARIENRENQTFRGQDGEIRSAGLQGRLPIFEGGFAWSRVRQSRSVVAQTQAETTSVRLQVEAQVRTAWNDLAAADRVVRASEDQVSAAQAALRGARAELAAGQRSTLDVLDTQRDVLDAELAVARAQRDQFVARYALESAVGTFSAERLGLRGAVYNAQRHRRVVWWKVVGATPADGVKD